MYGGCFATAPAYLADLFGTKYVGGIHGRLLTCWSVAGILGPQWMTYLRQAETDSAIQSLTAQADPALFTSQFGSGPADLQVLVDAKTVTISRLMEIMPQGVVDPTPFLYNSTMYSSVGLLVLATIANSQITPVDPKFYMKAGDPH
jgi:hypothetical protein